MLAQLDIPFLGAYTDQDALELEGGGRINGGSPARAMMPCWKKARSWARRTSCFSRDCCGAPSGNTLCDASPRHPQRRCTAEWS